MKIHRRIMIDAMGEHNMAQIDLANKTKLAEATIARALNGGDINLRTIIKLAKGLEIPPSMLIDLGESDS